MNTSNQHQAERACSACGSKLWDHFADESIDPKQINDFTYASRKQPEFMCLRLVRCKTCDLVYAPCPPANDYLKEAYSEAAYDSGPEAAAAARSYAKALKPYLTQLSSRDAAVDVGAGSGPLLPWLQECGFKPVIGIEPSQAAIDAAPPSIKPMLKEGMFSTAMMQDCKVSLLCSFMTLEHVAEPEELVSTAYDLLQPGGMLAVVVHNWRAPLNRVLGLRSPIIDVEHLQLFSPKSLRTLITRAGFDSIDIKPIGNTYPLRYWLRLTPLPPRLKKALSSVLDAVGISDIQITARVGNMLAVAIKPMEDK